MISDIGIAFEIKYPPTIRMNHNVVTCKTTVKLIGKSMLDGFVFVVNYVA